MEVIISSNLPDIKGRYHIRTPPEQSVKALLEQFCRENEVQMSRNYILSTSNDKRLNPSQKISHYGVKDGDTLYLDISDKEEVTYRSTKSDEISPSACSQWWLLALVALIIGCVGMVAVTLVKVNGDKQPEEYGIVFDAGSSHTKMFLYKWPGSKENGTGIVDEVTSCRVKGPGISSYSSTPEAAGRSLQMCINQANGLIPDTSYRKTPIFLGATAGMRLLNETNPANSSAIFSSVRTALKNTPYNFTNPSSQARILTGSEEGVFGWVTVNYLNNSFNTVTNTVSSWLRMSGTRRTTGALDLGGASTQFSFIPEDTSAIPADFQKTTLLYGYEYTVYTHSYLCYGLNEARRRYKANLLMQQKHKAGQTVSDPCMPGNSSELWQSTELYKAPCSQGPHALKSWGTEVPFIEGENVTFVGQGNSEECAAAVASLFNFSAPCPYKKCSFNGIYQPPVHGHHLAFSGFYYPVQFLNLTSLHPSGYFTLTEFEEAIGSYCNLSWAEVQTIPEEPDFKLLYCFQSTYIHTLLTHGYGFNSDNWHTLQFKQNVMKTEIGWTLGFMVNTTNLVPAEFPSAPFSLPVFVLLILLFCVFIILAVAFGCHARRSQLRLRQERYEKLSTYGAI